MTLRMETQEQDEYVTKKKKKTGFKKLAKLVGSSKSRHRKSKSGSSLDCFGVTPEYDGAEQQEDSNNNV